MAAGDPGSPARYYSSTAVETSLQASIPAQSQGQSYTSFIVASISGFPTSFPYTLIVDPDTSKEEVLTVTSGTSTTLTVTRGSDNTQAVAHSAGAVVRHGVSGREFREEQVHIAARGYDTDQAILATANQSHVHGLQTGDGVVVGTDAVQTLTRKTLSNPTITGVIGNIGITFEGNTADAHETTLEVVEPTQDNTIYLPNTSGTVVLATASQTISNKTLGSNLNAGGYTVTNLATPVNASDAVRKDFADAQVAAAATSAASAATSASSAATSATSAAASAATAAASVATIAGYATSAANSASAAATSATSAAASATSSATSASAAATSATAAATSATSAAASATAAATSASSASASATAAATSATSAATSATSAAASATTAAASVAAIAGYAAAAATSEANALTSATSAATSATSAANSATASATSASAAATSASSAATSATAAATSATSADSAASIAIAQAANASTSATSAATSATSAANSATAAATSATSAAASETASQGYATAASTSAASAATSATSAATTYDEFDDRYLGSKSSPPSVDNDGNPLLVGAIYWNSTLNNMYVWSGSAWVQIATTSVYSAPTLGTTTINSGTTYTTIVGLTLDGGLATADPTTNLGLATKQYVDAVVTQINYHQAVVAATTANLNATYSNGSSGVGATLTNAGTQAAFSIDGVSPVLNARVLVKDQTTQTENGIYTLTTVGDGSTNWVLTRATDADNSPTGELRNGDELYCSGGTVNTGKSFINSTTVDPIVIGTTNITFSEYYAGLPAQTGNSGKYLTTDGTTPSWGTVAGYSAPTLGSTTIASGSTNTTLVGFTKLRSDQFTTLDANGYEIDLELMTIMGAF
jgi:hypothetical protein